jgi:zinc D-Ala-D-Ala carboxypeptidase
MKLSKYVSLGEVVHSDTAKRRGIDNNPTAEHMDNLRIICTDVFDKVREHFGVPIYISSGYRGKELNAAIKGSASSDHCNGRALDLDQDYKGNGVSNREVFDYIKDNLDFDQLIYEMGNRKNPDWVHVGYRVGENRKQVLKAIRVDGKTKYLNYES